MGKDKFSIRDVFVIGGGINGAGIARDAAGRGLTVTLAEKDDLAAHTSSASSKLIHGGLRYLENYEFRLVRESLKERETLWKAAPHLISPLRFILPHHKAMRPAFILRLGLFLYDYIGGREILPPTRTRNLLTHESGAPLSDTLTKGFEYSDCWVDDARLVCMIAKDASERGANILVGHEVVTANRRDSLWTITTQSADGTLTQHQARTLVNAAGPWVDTLEEKASPAPKSKKKIRMVKGSHIVVPKLYEGAQAYTFQNNDNRVVFAVPYEENYTLIGTTDVPFSDDPSEVQISRDEENYLCEAASRYFKNPISLKDIIWSYAGVRPLVDDGAANASKTTRDYVLELDTQENAPLLSIYGGKITTFRCLSEEALHMLQPHLGFSVGNWTRDAVLPGGDMGLENFPAYAENLRREYSWVPSDLLVRFAKAYGTNSHKILKGHSALADLGQHFGAGFYEAELCYMCAEEWVRTAEDALWRRSKRGLHMSNDERASVEKWFSKKV
ncbi:MAG: glycerol-3-phosphate dehydrogenase [Kordiimonadaceae bacterium]|nr:glycerol-3-phosphate dehydrogenase [Kordiimonadaceae bacterium]